MASKPRNLGERLAYLRGLVSLEGKALSQRGVASLAGVAPTHIAMIENGRLESPQVSTLTKISKVFGVTLDWLAEGKDPQPTQMDVLVAVGKVVDARKAAKEARA